MPWRGKEDVRESGCLLIADTEVGQNPGSGETKALGPSSISASLPPNLPFRTEALQTTSAALPLPPPRPARPRALQLTALRQGSLCHACQSSANIRLRGGTGTAPSGAPAPQLLPPHLPTSGFLPGPNMAFQVSRPLPRVTCQNARLRGRTFRLLAP